MTRLWARFSNRMNNLLANLNEEAHTWATKVTYNPVFLHGA
jgi:hypothetical protein